MFSPGGGGGGDGDGSVVEVVVLINVGLIVVVSSKSGEICLALTPPAPPPLALLVFLNAGDTGRVEVIKLMRVVVVLIRLTSRVLVVSLFRFSFSRNSTVSIIRLFSAFKRRRPDLELVFIFLNLFLDFLEIRFRSVGRNLSSIKLNPFSVTENFC